MAETAALEQRAPLDLTRAAFNIFAAASHRDSRGFRCFSRHSSGFRKLALQSASSFLLVLIPLSRCHCSNSALASSTLRQLGIHKISFDPGPFRAQSTISSREVSHRWDLQSGVLVEDEAMHSCFYTAISSGT